MSPFYKTIYYSALLRTTIRTIRAVHRWPRNDEKVAVAHGYQYVSVPKRAAKHRALWVTEMLSSTIRIWTAGWSATWHCVKLWRLSSCSWLKFPSCKQRWYHLLPDVTLYKSGTNHQQKWVQRHLKSPKRISILHFINNLSLCPLPGATVWKLRTNCYQKWVQ